MKHQWNEISLFYLLPVLILFGMFFFSGHSTPKESGKDPEGSQTQQEEIKKKPAKQEILWGVDSASITTSEFYACVRENFGEPSVWGRYLGNNKGASFGITKKEASLLHSKKSSILLIYNHFTDARGYENGKQHGRKAIEIAKKVGVPPGVAIFADIEPSYPVDDAFIRGWHDTLAMSNYHPGIYGIFSPDRKLTKAFNQAADTNPYVKKETVIWTAFPQVGITSQEESPSGFQGKGPKDALIYGWQYGIDAEVCNIDTNLFKGEILEYLWRGK